MQAISVDSESLLSSSVAALANAQPLFDRALSLLQRARGTAIYGLYLTYVVCVGVNSSVTSHDSRLDELLDQLPAIEAQLGPIVNQTFFLSSQAGLLEEAGPVLNAAQEALNRSIVSGKRVERIENEIVEAAANLAGTAENVVMAEEAIDSAESKCKCTQTYMYICTMCTQ